MAREHTGLGAMVIAVLLWGVPACSSFDPAKQTRYQLLREGDDADLDLKGVHWHVYDDQHSLKSACTNYVAGDHEPWECSTLTEPRFPWDGKKCPPTVAQLANGDPVSARADGSICLRGVISAVLDCKTGVTSPTCFSAKSGDVSNMWGAGVGIEFSGDDEKKPWSPTGHRIGTVRGVAFDLVDFSEARDVALRVEIPIALDPNTPVPFKIRPLMRDDGSLIDTDGQLHRYDCPLDFGPAPQQDVVLADLARPGSPIVTSNQHPFGHPFWQLPPEKGKDPIWKPSPAKPGHNEFVWDDVKKPPEMKGNYEFDRNQLLGIEFHVVHPEDKDTTSIPFDFCIENLAFLLAE